MNNILIDFITLQKKTGAGEYQRRIFFSLLDCLKSKEGNHTVYALYDSRYGIAYEDEKIESLMPIGVKFLDVANHRISDLIEKNEINTFFIACAQYLGEYEDIENIKCRVVCVIHDLAYEELEDNFLNIYFYLENPCLAFKKNAVQGWKTYVKGPVIKFCKWILNKYSHGTFEKRTDKIQRIVSLAKKNTNVQLVTVSEYTKSSLSYYYGVNSEDIKVLFSPDRIYTNKDIIECDELRSLIERNEKYFLMVSANRDSKNPEKMVAAAAAFCEQNPDYYFVTLGYPFKKFKNQIILPFLSDSDLRNAYKHCYAFVYPSYFEGFGYPPLEAMAFAKPVIASYSTSIPEILETAPIYICPFYISSIFKGLMSLTPNNYQRYSQMSMMQYLKVKERQKRDLKEIINLIIDDCE